MSRSFSTLMILALLAIPPNMAAAEAVKDFTVPSVRDSSLIRLSDYSGDVVLIHWWRTSCGYCRRETPRLVTLRERYRDRGFEILGISDDTVDSVAAVPAYLEEFGITWPVGYCDQGEFVREIKQEGATPANYLVDRNGELTFLGLLRDPETDWRRIEEALETALAQPVPASAAIQPAVLPPAPDFALDDGSGRTVTLADFAGKPLVVNFFTGQSGSWAGQVFSDLHREYGPRGLGVVGIHLFGDQAAIDSYRERYGAEYPILHGDPATQKAWIGASKGWATFFVTAEGELLKTIVNSINGGIEAVVFRRYAEYLVVR